MIEVEENIKHYIVLYRAKEYTEDQVVGKILAIPGIRIETPDQSLPKYRSGRAEDTWIAVERVWYETAQQEMLKERWVKCYPKGEK